jgi:gamma-glutamyltranspeptidase/glutathione hydrolase
MDSNMVRKCLFNSDLKALFIIASIVFVVSCSGKNSEEWPKMQADSLWQDLEESGSQNDGTSEPEVANDDTSLLAQPYQEDTISISEIRETLRDVEFLIPQREKGIASALSSFESAAEQEKASYWRGVEIEKSRINDIASRLRSIEYQLAKSDQFLIEKQMNGKLLKQVERIIPDAPTTLNLTSMLIDEKNDAPFDNQMVVAANPYAAKAGLEILMRGGSAVDAAIAVETTLSLVEPQSSGIGGGAFLLHFDPEKPTSEQLNFYDGRETAPMAATPDLFKSFTDIDGYLKLNAVYGGLSVGVPGALAALKMAHDKHGVLPWAEVFEPAIKLAEEGFIVSPRLEQYITIDKKLMLVPASRKYFYDEAGKPWKAGHLLKNPKQAAVLKRIANEGISAFYTGEIAEKIVDAIKEAPNNPGLMELSDLENYKAKERDVICGDYRVYSVCSIPPPSSGGHTMIATLGMLNHFNIDKMEPHSAEAYNIILEAESLAYADRNQYTGDTDFIDVPVRGMINPDYLAERAKLIQPGVSMGKAPYGKPPTDVAVNYGEGYVLEIPSTTHFSITDKWGHVTSMTATVESMFGSRLMVEGFMLNNELTDFSLIPRDADGRMVANRVQGGKRPMSSQTPSIVFDNNNRPALIIGSPGGSSIINYVTQTMINVLDWNMDMQSAISAPHVISRNGPALVEEGTDAENLILPLEALGHEVNAVTLMSGLHGIKLKYDENGRRALEGGADPRREGYIAQ